MPAFLDLVAAEFRLTMAERAWIQAAAPRNWDALHALLRASAYLDAGREGIRRGALLQGIEAGAHLSDRYRARLDAPAPKPPAGGVLRPPPPGTIGAIPDYPAGWPSFGRPPRPGAEERVDLLGPLIDRWVLRDQGADGTCVGFAAVAAAERARTAPDARPPRFSATFLYRRMRRLAEQDPRPLFKPLGFELGATKLGAAQAVIQQEGLPPEADWPDDSDLKADPPEALLQRAQDNKVTPVAYWDLGSAKRPPGVARTVLDLLAAGRPVAVSMPVFVPPGSPPGSTDNWWLPSVVSDGFVQDPPPDWPAAPAGHAVCVLGFRPDPAPELGGGWFVFRNSQGGRWATDAPDDNVDDPIVPGRGYGAISARHVERAVWEIMSPALAP
jgi:hypothetical protein